MLHKLILENLRFIYAWTRNFQAFTDLNHSDLGLRTGWQFTESSFA